MRLRTRAMPRQVTRLSDSSPPDFDPVVHAELQQQMPVEAFARSSFGTDDERNERERTKENIGGETPTDAMRILPCRRARPRLKREAHDCRRSTAVLAPRSLSSQGTQPQAMFPGTRPLCMTGFPRPCLSQSSECTSRPGPSAEGLMPKAARERVASPPAGTALARAIWECLPGRVRLGEV